MGKGVCWEVSAGRHCDLRGVRGDKETGKCNGCPGFAGAPSPGCTLETVKLDRSSGLSKRAEVSDCKQCEDFQMTVLIRGVIRAGLWPQYCWWSRAGKA